MNYDYSERIAHNEERIAEIKGKIYTERLTVKALEKENERCFEAMNNCTSPIDTEKTKKDKQILDLNKELDNAKKTIKKLKKENKQLKVNVEYLETKLHDWRVEKLCKKTPSNDVILSDNFGENNIFKEYISGD